MYCQNVRRCWFQLFLTLVSSPHRYCQNLRPGHHPGARTSVFQALIGTAKTLLRFHQVLLSWHVSSPHRYCQNGCARLDGTSTSRFQALIGTAKTIAFGEALDSVFQVSSPHRYCQNPYELVPVPMTLWVSSPHRYCQNASTSR